jgi:TetR/AcrR family transcriptional repressor of bet genes
MKTDGTRREQLIDATLASIRKYGLPDVTVVQIAAAIGLSSGNIHYYFGGKNGLLEASMRKLFATIRERTTRELATAQSARERLEALVRAHFAPDIYRPEFCGAWLSFLAGCIGEVRLRRLKRISACRRRSTIRFALLQMMPRPCAELLAQELVAVIDGLWVRGAQQGLKISPAGAENIAVTFLTHRLSGY